jgi:hypothetical protein
MSGLTDKHMGSLQYSFFPNIVHNRRANGVKSM